MTPNSRAKPTAIDLFCGCGGLSLGLRRAGFNVAVAIDNDRLSVSTYRMNHKPKLLIAEDIRLTDGRAIMHELSLKPGELDLLAGCPPCQGFSTLSTLNGQRQIDDDMNDLVFEFLRFVRILRPRAVMIENVPRLLYDARFERLRQVLDNLGYTHDARVLNAANFGVAQRRHRLILLATLHGSPSFAPPVNRRRTVRGAIRRLPPPELSQDPIHNYPVRRAPHVMSLIRRIPKNGGSRTDLPTTDQLPCHKKCNGFSDIYGRMSPTEPSPTITGGCINPSNLKTKFGLDVTPGGLVHLLHRTARAAAPAYAALCEQVRHSPVVTPDETGWRVNALRHWLWAFATPETTVYAICDGRGFADAAAVLGPDFAGVLVRDGWVAYRGFKHAPHQSCLSHLLRRCKELQENHPYSPWAGEVQAVLQDGLALRDRCNAGDISEQLGVFSTPSTTELSPFAKQPCCKGFRNPIDSTCPRVAML